MSAAQLFLGTGRHGSERGLRHLLTYFGAQDSDLDRHDHAEQALNLFPAMNSEKQADIAADNLDVADIHEEFWTTVSIDPDTHSHSPADLGGGETAAAPAHVRDYHYTKVGNPTQDSDEDVFLRRRATRKLRQFRECNCYCVTQPFPIGRSELKSAVSSVFEGDF